MEGKQTELIMLTERWKSVKNEGTRGGLTMKLRTVECRREDEMDEERVK